MITMIRTSRIDDLGKTVYYLKDDSDNELYLVTVRDGEEGYDTRTMDNGEWVNDGPSEDVKIFMNNLKKEKTKMNETIKYAQEKLRYHTYILSAVDAKITADLKEVYARHADDPNFYTILNERMKEFNEIRDVVVGDVAYWEGRLKEEQAKEAAINE